MNHHYRKNRNDYLFGLLKLLNYIVIIWNFFLLFNISYYTIDVEQPYCILELNHPKQIQQTSIAKNGLNPYVNYYLF
jgi:hypothetical protein